jgi:hypothetical protein
VPKVVLEGEGKDVVVVEDVEVAAVVVDKVGGSAGGGVGGGGPLRGVVLEEVVCVALVEVPAGRGRRVASAVCVAVVEEVVCALVEARGRKVASVVCVAVVVEVTGAVVDLRACVRAAPRSVAWQPRCCSAANSRRSSCTALAWAREYCSRRCAAVRLGREGGAGMGKVG